MPVLSICCWNEIECIDSVKKILSDSKGNINIRKLMISRVAFCYLIMSITMFVKDEYFMIIMSGSIFGPVFGIIIPVD